jgi:hypothetical protein
MNDSCSFTFRDVVMPVQENTIYCQRFRNFNLIVTFASKNIYCPVHQELQAVPDNEPLVSPCA